MKGGAALHIVDAGYFDNSGSLAVIELLKSLVSTFAYPATDAGIYVISIRNDPGRTRGGWCIGRADSPAGGWQCP
jgi:hypothetical protein